MVKGMLQLNKPAGAITLYVIPILFRDDLPIQKKSIHASVVVSNLRNSSQSAQPIDTESRRIVSEIFLSKCSLPQYV